LPLIINWQFERQQRNTRAARGTARRALSRTKWKRALQQKALAQLVRRVCGQFKLQTGAAELEAFTFSFVAYDFATQDGSRNSKSSDSSGVHRPCVATLRCAEWP